MNLKRIIFVISLFSCVQGVPTVGVAQSELISFTPGAHAIGLGGTGVVGIYDPSAIYWNPAALSLVNQNRAYLSVHEPFLLNYGAYSHFFPLYGTFCVAIARTSSVGNAFESLNFGWGSQLTRSLHIGGNLGGLQANKEGWTIGGFGILYRPVSVKSSLKNSLSPNAFAKFKSLFIDNRLAVGVSAQNIPLVVADIDHEFRFGLSYSVMPWGPKIVSAYHVHQNDDTFHFGFESSPTSNSRLYVGIRDFDNKNLAFGFMVGWDNANVDIAYSTESERLIFSLSMRIGKSPEEKAESRIMTAKSEIKSGDLRKALTDVRKALDYDFTQPEARTLYTWLAPKIRRENTIIDSLLTLAKAHERQEWYISAAAHYLKVLKIDPNNKEALHNIAMIRPRVNIHTQRWFQSGVKRFEQGDYARAKDIFESILLVRNDHQGSRDYLDRIHKIAEEEAEKHFYMGLGFYTQKNYERAEEEFEKVLEVNPDHNEAGEYLKRVKHELTSRKEELEQLLVNAKRLQDSGKYVSAIRTYQRIRQLDPQNRLAAEHLRSLDEVVKSYVQKNFATGEKAFSNGDIENAEKAFKSVLSLNSRHSSARAYLTKIEQVKKDSAKVEFKLGMEHFNASEWEPALASFDAALTLYPGYAEAKEMRQKVIDAAGVHELVEHGKSAYLSGHYLQAMEIFNEVLDNDPTNSDAIELRERCQNRLNEEVEMYYNRGIRYYTAEDYRAAIEEWDKALGINPQHKGSLEYKQKAEQRLRALNDLQ